MASGINSTFRQVGIATGIAGLGSLFSHKVHMEVLSLLSGAPHLPPGAARALAAGISQGNGAAAGLSKLPPAARPEAVHAVHTAFTAGLNEIFLVGAIIALAASVLTVLLIRSRDFEAGAARGPRAAASPAAAPSPGAAPHPAAPEQPSIAGAAGTEQK
jgi:hypothetical protein